MIVPTYLDKTTTMRPSFQEWTIFFMVKMWPKIKLRQREFYSSKCSDIIKIENDILYGNIPSRSRKDPGMKKNVMLNKDELQKNIYVYFNDKFLN